MSNLNDPVLPGNGASDYERYLRTDELLALQKAPGEMAHRDELLFQTIHQTAELWLKLASLRGRNGDRPHRRGRNLARRAAACGAPRSASTW